MKKHKISVITINLDNKKGLLKTIESVIHQSYANFEYIVIDGSSKDGSYELLLKYASKINKWLSEQDKGIYNAMNKGIALADGEYLIFLNSGDYFVNHEVLSKVSKYFNDNIKVCTGDLLINDGAENQKAVSPVYLTLEVLLYGSISHPSSFIHYSLFEKYGYYNENYRIVSDWEFFLITLLLNNESYFKIEELISVFNKQGISENIKYKKIHEQERHEVLNRLFPKKVLEYVDVHHSYTRNIGYNFLSELSELSRYRYLRKALFLIIRILNFFSVKTSK